VFIVSNVRSGHGRQSRLLRERPKGFFDVAVSPEHARSSGDLFVVRNTNITFTRTRALPLDDTSSNQRRDSFVDNIGGSRPLTTCTPSVIPFRGPVDVDRISRNNRYSRSTLGVITYTVHSFGTENDRQPWREKWEKCSFRSAALYRRYTAVTAPSGTLIYYPLLPRSLINLTQSLPGGLMVGGGRAERSVVCRDISSENLPSRIGRRLHCLLTFSRWQMDFAFSGCWRQNNRYTYIRGCNFFVAKTFGAVCCVEKDSIYRAYPPSPFLLVRVIEKSY